MNHVDSNDKFSVYELNLLLKVFQLVITAIIIALVSNQNYKPPTPVWVEVNGVKCIVQNVSNCNSTGFCTNKKVVLCPP